MANSNRKQLIFIYLLVMRPCGILVPRARMEPGPDSESAESYPLIGEGIPDTNYF